MEKLYKWQVVIDGRYGGKQYNYIQFLDLPTNEKNEAYSIAAEKFNFEHCGGEHNYEYEYVESITLI
jgi:hypothetical protein